MLEPNNQSVYYRSETIPVRVELDKSEYFGPEKFTLEARIALNKEGHPGAKGEGPFPLTEVADGRQFQGRIPLDALPRGDGPLDYYTLSLTVTGREDLKGWNSLGGFGLDLPGRIIKVNNAIKLAAEPSSVRLSRDQPRGTITLQAGPKVAAEVPLTWKFDPPRALDGSVAAPVSAFAIRQEGEAAGKAGSIRLRKGRATLKIALNEAEIAQLDANREFANGRLTIAGAADTVFEPLTIEVGLRLLAVELAQSEHHVELESKDGGDRSKPITLSARGAFGVPRPSVVLSTRDDNSPKFKKDELYLEPCEAGDPPGQTLHVDLNKSFRIVFKPDPRLDRRDYGTFDWFWTVEAKGAARASGTLKLKIQPPRIIVQDKAPRVYASPGESPKVELRVRLERQEGDKRVEGRPEDKRIVRFVPDRIDGDHVVFERTKGKGPETARVAIAYPGRDAENPPIEFVVASPGAGRPAVPINLGVTVAPNLLHGEYRMRGKLIADDALPAEIELKLVVNALNILVESKDDAKENTWKESREVSIHRFYEDVAFEPIRVRTMLDDPLAPARVTVEPILGPFKNEDSHDIKELPTAEVVQGSDDREVKIWFRFPPVSTAWADRAYTVSVDLKCPDLQLSQPTTVKFEVRHRAKKGPF